MKITNILNNIFSYNTSTINRFIIPTTPNNIVSTQGNKINIYNDYSKNINFIKVTYSTLINSDITLKEFKIKIAQKELNASLIFVDGMVNSDSINEIILKPLLYKRFNYTSSKNPKITRY